MAKQKQDATENVPAIRPTRLPYHPAVEERFGISKSDWIVLVEAIWPDARTTESVVMALAYCKARNLDPFKRQAHIVPVWNSKLQKEVETVWPGIAELRTTAMRTKLYAGRTPTQWGPDVTQSWGELTVTFPEWAQIDLFRMVDGEKMQFCGPRVYWMEAYASKKGGSPNSMWAKRPRGQIEKCAEAAALRAAFPEELGDEPTYDEGHIVLQAQETPKAISTESGVNGLRKRIEASQSPEQAPDPTDEPQEQEIGRQAGDGEPEQPSDEPVEDTGDDSWAEFEYHCDHCNFDFDKPKGQTAKSLGLCPKCLSKKIRKTADEPAPAEPTE